MARLRRRWRVAKWCGAILSLVCAVAWLASLHWWVYGWNPHLRIDLEGGAITCSKPMPNFLLVYGDTGWCWWTGGNVGAIAKMPRFASYNAIGGYRLEAMVPLWIPFLLLVIPTAYLFWLDRRRIPAHCCQSCGYDLTGNTSGTCPECGGKA